MICIVPHTLSAKSAWVSTRPVLSLANEERPALMLYKGVFIFLIYDLGVKELTYKASGKLVPPKKSDRILIPD